MRTVYPLSKLAKDQFTPVRTREGLTARARRTCSSVYQLIYIISHFQFRLSRRTMQVSFIVLFITLVVQIADSANVYFSRTDQQHGSTRVYMWYVHPRVYFLVVDDMTSPTKIRLLKRLRVPFLYLHTNLGKPAKFTARGGL